MPDNQSGKDEHSDVSVVIPCFNQGRFLADSIESALNQTCRPFEIIVVDDGSTDETAQVLSRYPNIVSIIQSNAGVAAARNAGFEKSRGNFLIFIDADDRLLPKAVEIGTQVLKQDQTLGFAYGHCTLISADGIPLFTPIQHPVEDDHYRKLLEHCYIWTPGTVMFTRSAVKAAGGFDQTVSPSADYELFLDVARLFPVRCHSQLVLEYRQHRDNVSANRELMLASVLRVLNAQREYVNGNDGYKDSLEMGFRFYRNFYADSLFKEVRLRVGARTQQITAALAKASSPTDRDHCVRQWKRLHDWSGETLDLVLNGNLQDDNGVGLERHELERAQEVAKIRGQLAEFTQRNTTLRQRHADLLRILELTSQERESALSELQELRSIVQSQARELHQESATEIRIREIQDGSVLVKRFRKIIAQVVPDDASVLVVSKGDDRLVRLDDRKASHFPQSPEGLYSGYHPLDAAEAIQHLQNLHASGADYIIFPDPSLWWLDYYVGFAAHLNEQHERIASEPGVCTIYRLRD